jgi:hypothetical protein
MLTTRYWHLAAVPLASLCSPGNHTMAPLQDLGVAEIFFLAQAVLFGSGLVLFGFTTFLRFVTQTGSRGSGGALEMLQPLAALLKAPLEFIYGKAVGAQYGLTEILLTGLLVVLLGMWRTQHRLVVATRGAAGAGAGAGTSATQVRQATQLPAASAAAKKD